MPQAILTNPILEEWNSELRAIPELDSIAFARLGGYSLEGEVTQIIRSAGAYRDSDVSIDEARSMARDFVDALSDGDTENLIAYRTYDYWSKWFCDIAWDVTLLVVDQPRRRIWLVCVTDTD